MRDATCNDKPADEKYMSALSHTEEIMTPPCFFSGLQIYSLPPEVTVDIKLPKFLLC